jgi:hypothetical protein
MEAIVFEDSPLADYLEGLYIQATDKAADCRSLTLLQVRAEKVRLALRVSGTMHLRGR